MRKKLLSILVLTILVASALVGCGQVASTPSTLTILSITNGNVFVMKAGTDSWTEAQAGMSLEAGDSIKTGDSSGAEITFFDGSTIELQAGTEIEIASLDIAGDTGATTITLQQTIGTTISRVTKLLDPASSYEVETPAGVAAVRGSMMIVRIIFNDPNYEDGTVLITNLEGHIYFIGHGEELQLPEGAQVIANNETAQLVQLSLAADDSVTTDEDTSVTVAAPGVLGNDSGLLVGDTLAVTAVDTSGTVGTVTAWGSDGSFTYDPNGQFEYLQAGNSTTDSFTYTVSDDYGITDTATVTITINGVDNPPVYNPPVNHPPVAVDDDAITDEDNPVTVAATGVLNNDSDPDGDTLTVTAVNTSGAVGNVTAWGADGSFTYDPNGQFEYLQAGNSTTDSFTYTVSDGKGGTDNATVTINITGVNDPPVAVNDSYITDEDTPITIAAPGVSNNDSDPDGDTLTVTAVNTSGTAGNVTAWGADGSFTYDPNGQFEYLPAGNSTTDSFTYTVSDGHGGTDNATVTINITGVNDPPTDISLDNSSVAENQPSGTAVGNFSTTDPDTGDTFTYSLVSGNGSTDNSSFNILNNSLRTSASFDYETKNSYSIRLRTTDSGTLYYEEAFNITVTNANDPPVAVADNATTPQNTPVTIDVLNNDYDVDNDTFTVVSVTPAANGTVTYNATDVTYTPALNFTGTDSFNYTISDGNGGTATATVTVTVTVVATLASIQVTIDTGPTANIYIQDSTTGNWAIDEVTGWSVNGTNHQTSAKIYVAGGHSYCVWVGAANITYDVNHCPSGWSISTLEGGGEKACGTAAAGSNYPVHFTQSG
jgi:VCBS repeat-containing protein